MNSVSKIIESKKCFACGMCYSVCPADAITVNADKKSGFFNIAVSDKCVACKKCLSVCPANESREIDNNSIGEYKSIFLAHSKNDKVRKMSTSGGVVNSIIRYIIENDVVKSAYIVKENIDCTFESEVIKIDKNNIDLLLNIPRSFASRYISYPVLSALKNEDKTDIAVVGTPCQINALAKYDAENTILKIGIACSGATSYLATQIVKQKLLSDNSKAHIFYRGNGWPGCNSLVTEHKTIETAHGKSYFEKLYSSQIFRRKSCLDCYDHFAEQADISLFDFWNPQEMKTEKIGNSAVIVRTDKGQKILQNAIESNYIGIQSEITLREALDTQRTPLYFKKYKPYQKRAGVYYKFAEIFRTLKLYKIMPLSAYKYFCRILNKLK